MDNTRRRLNLAGLLAGAVGLLAASGCTSPPRLVDLPPMPAMPQGQARLVLIYHSAILAPNNTWTPVLDDCDLGSIDKGQYALVPLAPGHHTLSVKRTLGGFLRRDVLLKLDLAAGRTVYVMVLHAGGLSAVEEDIAARWMQGLREVKV